MDVIILCGGRGTRLKEETEYKPKPMVEIGGKPILWHIMRIYAHFGFKRFILALGYRGQVIRDYFLNYQCYNHDFTVKMGKQKDIQVHGCAGNLDWEVTLAETGVDSMTGSRIKRCEKYVTGDQFMVTYGDGLADIDIAQLTKFHLSHNKIGTLTGVRPPGRYGELDIENNQIKNFEEKARPQGPAGDINGGFMVFNRKFMEYLSTDEQCVLEKAPLERLAQEGELMLYHHDGYWQCMDMYRDYLLLQETWQQGRAPWTFD